ncbi:MAG: hypothetical protein WAT39_00795 [Planctomycetota bacterium]
MNPANLLRSFALSTAAALLLPATGVAQTATIVGTGCHGMSLVTDELPDVTTAPFNFQVSGIPTGSILNMIWWSFASTGVGIDLGMIGAPGCQTFLAGPMLYAINWTPVGTTDTFPSSAPWVYNTNGWINLYSTWQAVSLVPGINQSGIVTSNMVDLVGG